MPEWLLTILRYSHITAGFVGLVAFWIPVFAKKGSPLHIRAGRVFEMIGYYVAATALFACARNGWLYTSSLIHGSPSASDVAEIHFVQFFVSMLAFLALLFLSALRSGVRVVRTRKTGGYSNGEARFWLFLLPVVGCLLIACGFYRLWQSNFAATYHWVAVGLGVVPMVEFRKELAFFREPAATKMAWWYRHMECMIGVGVAFHTAAFVFTSRVACRMFGTSIEGAWNLIPWLLPTTIGVPAAHFWVQAYRRKFNDNVTAEPTD